MTRETSRARAARLITGYGAIVAVLPYLALKVLWVGGVMVGVPADSPAATEGFVGPNVVTGAMDLAAIAVALAFTHRWGMRIPAVFVVVPAWIATGFLVPVDAWAYQVVYGSFAAQGVLLTAALALYVRRRWGPVLAAEPGGMSQVQRVLVLSGAVAAAFVAVAHVAVAFGPGGSYQDGWEYTARSGKVVSGLMACLAVAGAAALWRARTRFRTAILLLWTGSGAMFAYALLTVAGILAAIPESETVTPLERWAHLGALVFGLTLAVAGAGRLEDASRVRVTGRGSG